MANCQALIFTPSYMRLYTGINKVIFLVLMSIHFVYSSFAQNELLIRPSVGLQNVFAKTMFPTIEKIDFRNNVYDEHFYAGIEMNWTINKTGFIYLLADTRLGGYSFSATYRSAACPLRISYESVSEASSFTAFGTGYGHLIKRRKINKDISSEIFASSGFSLLVNDNNNQNDYISRKIVCNDAISYRDNFLQYKNTGVGLQVKLYFDVYLKKRPLFSLAVSYLKGLRNITYDQLITEFNSSTYTNTFTSKGSGFTVSLGYPIKFFTKRPG